MGGCGVSRALSVMIERHFLHLLAFWGPVLALSPELAQSGPDSVSLSSEGQACERLLVFSQVSCPDPAVRSRLTSLCDGGDPGKGG